MAIRITPGLIGALFPASSSGIGSWDPNDNVGQSVGFTLSNDNKDALDVSIFHQIRGADTVGLRKVYFEIELITPSTSSANNVIIGVANKNDAYGAHWATADVNKVFSRCGDAFIYEDAYSSIVAITGGTNNLVDTAGDLLLVAIDGISDKIWLGSKTSHGNSGWWNSGDPAAGTGNIATSNTGLSAWAAYAASDNVGNDFVVRLRAKQSELILSPPSGFRPIG